MRFSKSALSSPALTGKNYEVHYVNFSPTPEEELLVEKTMGRIEAQAPGHSFLDLCVYHEQGHYRARLTVNSFTRDFFSRGWGADVASTMERVAADLATQLKSWKSGRAFPWAGHPCSGRRFDPHSEGGAAALA